MAEETDHVPVRDKIIIGGVDDSKPHSNKKPLVVKKKAKKADSVPHYLRASTGSCHDSCKYGKPHVFIEKPWKTARRRMSAPLSDAEDTVEIQIFVDKKLKKAKDVKKIELSSSREPLPTEKMRTHPFLRRSPVHESSKLVKQEVKLFMKSPSPEAPRIMKKGIRSPVRSSLPDTWKLSKKEVASSAKRDVPLVQKPENPKVRSVSAGPLRPNSKATKPSSSPDILMGSSGKQANESKFGDDSRSTRVAARKTLTPSATTLSLKRIPKLEVKKPFDASTTKSMLQSSGSKTAKANVVRNTNGKDSKGQNLVSQASARIKKSAVVAAPKDSVKEIVEEKTLHMIETKDDCLSAAPSTSHFIQSPSPLSPESLNSSSQANSLSFTSHEVDDQSELDLEYIDSEADDAVSSYNGSGDVKAVESSNEGRSRDSGNRDPVSLKLKSRRGKAVELESGINSPRRLRFRQGGSLADEQGANSGAKRKSFKKKATTCDKTEAVTGLAKVSLKHQEVATKKDEQVLLNNVIKETASKLVEKRKSKVKALVGAFETVISLQERKPSAANK